MKYRIVGAAQGHVQEATELRSRKIPHLVGLGLWWSSAVAWIPCQQALFQGMGYRRIADELGAVGAITSKSSVERLIKGWGCYRGRRGTLTREQQ